MFALEVFLPYCESGFKVIHSSFHRRFVGCNWKPAVVISVDITGEVLMNV